MTQEQTIPVVDLQQYTNGDAQARQAFVQKFGDALKEFGFAAIENHGIDKDLLDRTYGDFKSFFDRDVDYKQRFEDPSTGRQRGYTSYGVEHAKNNKKADLKEFFHLGREITPDHELHGRMVPNIWPEGMDGLKDDSLSLFNALEGCAMTLLEVVSVYLDQEPDFLPSMAHNGSSIVRVIHYPAVDGSNEPGAMRAAQHEDINLMTILPESTESGLELLTRDGTWLPVHAIPGQIIVDSGDMMSRITNGVLPATTHRVVNPSDEPAGEPKPRYSMPFFIHPHPDAVLEVLSDCLAEGEQPKHQPITSEEFLMERLKEIGLKK